VFVILKGGLREGSLAQLWLKLLLGNWLTQWLLIRIFTYSLEVNKEIYKIKKV